MDHRHPTPVQPSPFAVLSPRVDEVAHVERRGVVRIVVGRRRDESGHASPARADGPGLAVVDRPDAEEGSGGGGVAGGGDARHRAVEPVVASSRASVILTVAQEQNGKRG